MPHSLNSGRVWMRASVSLLSLGLFSGQANAQSEPPLMMAASAAPAAAAAAQAGDSALAGARELEGVDDIIVTAQRRSQNINDIPLTIQAFSGEQLTAAGVSDASGLSQITPAFNFARSSANTPIYTIRGIGFQTPNLSATSPVGIYVDELAYAYPYMSNGPIFDLERVEVLKGPQGTLYGRNTTGGLVNFITAKPTKDFSAGATVEIGNYETINMDGYVSIPLTATLGLRLASRWETAGKGWQKSVSRPGDRLGEKDRLGARATLAWDPSPSVRVLLSGSYWEDNSDTIATQAVAATPDQPALAVPNLASFTRTDWGVGEADWGPERAGKSPYRSDSHFYSISGRVDVDLTDALTITSLTGYNYVRRKDHNDVDGTGFEIAEYTSDGAIKSFSQELRLSGDHDRVKWMVGGYYSRDVIRDNQIGYSDLSSSIQLLRFAGLQVPQNVYTPQEILSGFRTSYNRSSQWSRSLSVFGNIDYEITPEVTVSGGLRYSDDSLRLEGCSADYQGNTAPVWNTGTGAVIALLTGRPFRWLGLEANQCLTFTADFTQSLPINKRKLKEDNVSGRLAVNWKPNDGTLLYASVSRGFKSGAFPVISANVETQLEPATQERVTAYEAGAKLSLADRLLQFNAAGFYYDYRDKQLFGEIQDPIFTSLTRIINIPKSRVWGAEGELTVRPSRQLTLRLGGAYTNTRVLEFNGFDRLGLPRNFEGSPFPYTPRWQFNGMLDYDLPLGEDSSLQLTLTGNYQGKTAGNLRAVGATAADRVQEAYFAVKSYTVVNGAITFKTDDERLRIGVFARNLFNENYYTASDIVTDTVVRVPGMARTYGVSLGYRF